jgi:ArsR family transcriptional regulator, arsenate/arsenite/antimonite-responsive transcriptional repressor
MTSPATISRADAALDSLKRHAALFHALSDPRRLRILDLLRSGEQCVCDLQAALDCGQSLLSFHLKTLKEAGLVSMRREGRWGFYQLATETVEHAEQAIAAYRVPVAERRKLPVACCS